VKPLDLLELFDKGASAYVFIATYDFDPQFFERRMLGRKTFASADRIVIFMDSGRYHEMLRNGLTVSGFNRRYLVIPMDRSPGAFHPKLYLAIGEKRTDCLIGSNNCTAGGIAYNMELSSAFSVQADSARATDITSRNVVRQIYETMRTYSVDAPHLHNVLDDELFLPIETKFPWLKRDLPLPQCDIELLTSHSVPLWGQLTKRLEAQAVRKITVIAPFYDREIGLLKRLRQSWPSASLTIVAQQKYATLAGKKLAKLFTSNRKDRLLAVSPKPGRRLHAKAFAFETRDATFWLTGSPNATLAALDGKNSEAAIWFQSKERADVLLEDDDIPFKEIKPSEFEAGTDPEPSNDREPLGLRLRSAILSDNGALECTFEASDSLNELTLRVRNYNETLPVLSFPLRRSSGLVLLDLTENQIAQIRVAAICEIKGKEDTGLEVLSNPVALVQLYHLLRERPAQSGGGNALKTITETGENLVPYVDSLGSVREAIEFFDNCSIRFHDGEDGSRKGNRGDWKPRDPFKPDTPVNWLNVPAGSSTDEFREAIWNFVQRHQGEKLYRHVRRGNLNGLPNFLDIFRTLNSLLLTYHGRAIDQGGSVIPFAFVTKGIMDSLELLIGPFEEREDQYEGNGFIAAILTNISGDKEIVRERLREERVAEMIGAAVEAMVEVRMKARKMVSFDGWSTNRLRWVSNWIKLRGLATPTAAEIRAAALEYMPAQRAA